MTGFIRDVFLKSFDININEWCHMTKEGIKWDVNMLEKHLSDATRKKELSQNIDNLIKAKILPPPEVLELEPPQKTWTEAKPDTHKEQKKFLKK